MEKPHVNLVFIGHVDHGKSTLIGRLLVELGVVSEKELSEEAGSFKFAWLVDHEKEDSRREFLLLGGRRRARGRAASSQPR